MADRRAYIGYAASAIVLLIAWEIIALWCELPVIPPPHLVAVNLTAIFIDAIMTHCMYSLWRIMAGVVLAVAAGVPCGMVMGYCRRCDLLLAPLVYLTYPIPKIALLPVVMLLCGLGELTKIWMIFLIIVFQVIIAVRDAVKGIPKETYYPLYSLGAGYGDIFKLVLWPAVLPKLLTAVRVAMATSISVLFFTETFGSEFGMGYFIMDAWLRVSYIEMYSGIIVLSFIGLLLFGFIDALENLYCRWQYK